MSSANPNHVEDQDVVQYLLGAAPEEQTELLDRLSISDDDFACRLRALEDDLVDAYVRGELSGDTLERFRRFYLSSPLRREKVRFAEALLPLADRRAPVPVVPARRFTLSFPRLFAAAAACLVLAAGVFWTFVNSRPAPRVQPDLAAAPPPPVSSTPAPLASILFVLPPPTRRRQFLARARPSFGCELSHFPAGTRGERLTLLSRGAPGSRREPDRVAQR